MLESLRKHNYVLMCVIATIVIIAFSVWLNPNKDMHSDMQVVDTVFGKPVTKSDVANRNQSIAIANMLHQMGVDRTSQDFMSQYTGPLFKFSSEIPSLAKRYEANSRDYEELDGAINIGLVEHECEALGISVDKEDLGKFVQSLKAFQVNGQFSSDKYEKFLTQGALGDRSTTEIKLFTAVREVLLYQKLREVIGSDLPPSTPEIESQYAAAHQLTTVVTALLPLASQPVQTVTDEDVQKFYEGEKGKPIDPVKPAKFTPGSPPPDPAAVVDPLLLTTEKRTIKYMRFNQPAEPAPPPPAPALTAPAALNEEELKKLPEADRKAKEEEHKKLMEAHTAAQEAHTKALADHSKSITDHTAAVTAWKMKVEKVSNDLASDERGSATFEEIAKRHEVEVKTATFDKSGAPDDIKADSELITHVFAASSGNQEETVTAADKKAYTVFALAGVEKAAVKPLEQVKAQLMEKLIKDKAQAALKAAAASARSNILEALKAGKSFKEAAVAQNLIASDSLTFSPSNPLKDNSNAALIKKAADGINAGEVSEFDTVADGALLVYVEKKELMQDPKMAEQKAAMKKQDNPFQAPALLSAWFSRKRAEAKAINN